MKKVYFPFYKSFRCVADKCPMNCCTLLRVPFFKWEEDFVNTNYSADSEVAIKERHSRFLNMVNLQALFDGKKRHFPRERREWISGQLKDSYNSQDFNRLRQELRKSYG